MSSLPALDNFLAFYHQSYMDKLGEPPRYYPRGEQSDCIEGEYLEGMDESQKVSVTWRAVKRQVKGSFDNIDHALEMTLHSDINHLYGDYFAAPLMFNSQWGDGELLQVWNDNDFDYLQQNLIGHLMMKQKLKQPATWFIGVLGEGDQMLVVNNEDGSVWIEIPGDEPQIKLADTLDAFISVLTPRVCPPQLVVEESMASIDHPGIWQRFKTMWQNLLGKR
ncbi:SecY-interacting protein [Shewanella colwelliana]|uniref:SecY-interacting protein n=1 Tax=Shewanella colwelliana TaxID=23 RepID=UPI0022AFF3AC|nr:SecY-interacting protein [Shewanella colwelliana]MCZ4338532.1 SecY-interacting protein [Shewanella colwelliana]